MQHLHFSCFFMVFFRSSTKAPMTTSIKNQAALALELNPENRAFCRDHPCFLIFLVPFVFNLFRLSSFDVDVSCSAHQCTVFWGDLGFTFSDEVSLTNLFSIQFLVLSYAFLCLSRVATCFYAFPILPSSYTYTPYTKMHWMIFGQWRSWNISAFFFARRMELQHWTLPRHGWMAAHDFFEEGY